MKKLLYLLIAIILIVIVIFLCNTENKNKGNTILVNSNILENNNKNEIDNKQEYEVAANEIEKEIENTLENEISKNVVENTTSSEIFVESPKTAEEKAIDIVKKDFEKNSNAEFLVEGIDGNGNYIVTVRNSKTTEALAFYNVNIANQTFTKREMN